MKNIIKIIGLGSLICFSFFYTDKVINVVSEQDEIMIKLNQVKDKYKINSIDAKIIDDTIIPGIKGRQIDIDKSYKEMKEIGKFSEMLITYKEIPVPNSLDNNYDKYIVKGNELKKKLSLLVIITNKKEVDLIKNIDYVDLNIFINYEVLSKNINELKKNNFTIYPYETNGIYSDDILKYSNNIINNNYNKAIYCLTKTKNKETLDVCNKNKMHTIIPNVIINNNLYANLKPNIKNGNIILISLNNKNISELKLISDFINSKGIKIVSLNKLLNED